MMKVCDAMRWVDLETDHGWSKDRVHSERTALTCKIYFEKREQQNHKSENAFKQNFLATAKRS